MSVRKMVAIIVIWMVATGGWVLLGGTTLIRTEGLLDHDSRVAGGVEALWGKPQVQKAPTLSTGEGEERETLQFSRGEVTVLIDAQNRKRGLGWFPVYDVRFTGAYTVTNDATAEREYTISFERPESNAEFLEQQVTIDDTVQPQWQETIVTLVGPGESSTVTFSYHSKGTRRWTYDLPDDEMIRDTTITVRIDQPGFDFDLDSDPPKERAMEVDEDDRYTLVWHKKMVTNARDVSIIMPKRDQPGRLVTRISFFAPVALFFFVVVMISIQIVKKLDLHPMHYLFLAGAFFAFHLLMAYMVAHVEVQTTFWISAAVSVLLVVMYLWLVAGPKTAILYAGMSQLVYLVLFSYSFFFENFTGLTVTIGSVITLAVLMVLTAKVRWGEQMPELERKRKNGWTPVADAAMPPAEESDTDVPGFLGEKPQELDGEA